MINFKKQIVLVPLLLTTASATLNASEQLPFTVTDNKLAADCRPTRSVAAFLVERKAALRRHVIALKESIVPLPVIARLSVQEAEAEAAVAGLNIDTLAAIETPATPEEVVQVKLLIAQAFKLGIAIPDDFVMSQSFVSDDEFHMTCFRNVAMPEEAILTSALEAIRTPIPTELVDIQLLFINTAKNSKSFWTLLRLLQHGANPTIPVPDGFFINPMLCHPAHKCVAKLYQQCGADALISHTVLGFF